MTLDLSAAASLGGNGLRAGVRTDFTRLICKRVLRAYPIPQDRSRAPANHTELARFDTLARLQTCACRDYGEYLAGCAKGIFR
jgi:hypothetical protein